MEPPQCDHLERGSNSNPTTQATFHQFCTLDNITKKRQQQNRVRSYYTFTFLNVCQENTFAELLFQLNLREGE